LCIKSIPDLTLLIVGDGPMRHELEKLVIHLGIEDKVIFTGFKTEPITYLSIMDVFLLSSFTEGTSMTLLEAMCLSKPCVVTCVGGNPEVIDHLKTGVVVASDDSQAFSKAILTLLGDVPLMKSYGAQANKRFNELFEVGIMIKAFSKLYAKSVLN
jgi:glycosyltransferase involved in cell wall biosynthesis